MPAYLVQSSYNGALHHSIDYQMPERPRERLGRELNRIEIPAKIAGAGLDALVRLYFPGAQNGE